MFWKSNVKEGEERLPAPKSIPEMLGRHMVVQLKKNPDWVWGLKGVLHQTDNKRFFYCRVFDEKQAANANVKVKDWASLDARPELILWEGRCDKDTNEVLPQKFENNKANSGRR